MIESHRVAVRGLGIGSLVGALIVLAAVPPVRASAGGSTMSISIDPADVPCDHATVPDAPGLSAPPAREGTYRPSHFSIASVIVSVNRSRCLVQSRTGGLYGP